MRSLVLVCAAMVALSGCMGSTVEDIDEDEVPRTETGDVDLSAYGVNGDPFRGERNASVQVIAFDAPGCPNCARYHSQHMQGILEDFADTGKIGYHYLQYTVGYGYDIDGGVAAECAYVHGNTTAYEFMIDRLFSTMYRSGQIPGHLEDAAATHGLDNDALQQCYDDAETRAEVDADIAGGKEAGVARTPGFVVIGPNGVQLVGGSGGPRDAIEIALAA